MGRQTITADITAGLQIGRVEVLRGLRNFLNMDRPEHHSTDSVMERGRKNKANIPPSEIRNHPSSSRPAMVLFQRQPWGNCHFEYYDVILSRNWKFRRFYMLPHADNLQIKLACPSSHSIPTLGQLVLALTPQCQQCGRIAQRKRMLPISLVTLMTWPGIESKASFIQGKEILPLRLDHEGETCETAC